MRYQVAGSNQRTLLAGTPASDDYLALSTEVCIAIFRASLPLSNYLIAMFLPCTPSPPNPRFSRSGGSPPWSVNAPLSMCFEFQRRAPIVILRNSNFIARTSPAEHTQKQESGNAFRCSGVMSCCIISLTPSSSRTNVCKRGP
jgi:hypothetical protein